MFTFCLTSDRCLAMVSFTTLKESHWKSLYTQRSTLLHYKWILYKIIFPCNIIVQRTFHTFGGCVVCTDNINFMWKNAWYDSLNVIKNIDKLHFSFWQKYQIFKNKWVSITTRISCVWHVSHVSINLDSIEKNITFSTVWRNVKLHN